MKQNAVHAGCFMVGLASLTSLGGCPSAISVSDSKSENLSVDAGSDQTIVWPLNSVELNGQVSVNGLASSAGQPDLLWEVDEAASSSTQVLFADPGAAQTTVSFGEPGTYVLRLTATSGSLSAQDSVIITVAANAWTQQAKLLADDGAASDEFGFAVALDGDRAVVGAMWNDSAGFNTGAAYVYHLNDGQWVQKAKLVPEDGLTADQFGVSVAIDGDWLVVGASWHAENGESKRGAAYVYQWTGTEWKLHSRLVASDGAQEDEFGDAVAIRGEWIVVGAPYDADGEKRSGSAYVFRHTGDTWTEKAKLTPADGNEGDEFGAAVAVSDRWIVVGARRADAAGVDSGAAYVFGLSDGGWQQAARLSPPDGAADDRFGVAVSADGDRVVVGAYLADAVANDSGAAYVFRADAWQTPEATLVPPEAAAGDQFGVAVGISGDRIVIGSQWDDAHGAAYVFRLDGVASWILDGVLQASDRDLDHRLGVAVGVSGERVCTGAPGQNDNGRDSGAAYIFEHTATP